MIKKINLYKGKFYSPGFMVADTQKISIDIEQEDLTDPHFFAKVALSLEWPTYAYMVSIKKTKAIIYEGQQYLGKEITVGNFYHLDCKIESVDEIKRNHNTSSALLKNIEYNKWRYIIWNQNRTWSQPFYENEDILLQKAQ